MFEIPRDKTRRPWSVPVAMMGELLTVAILASMPATHVQLVPALVSRIILAPVPPPPPPPPAPRRQEPLKSLAKKFDAPKLTAPSRIPREIVMELPQAPEIAGILGGVPDGVPGGVPGGVSGGVLGGILNSPPPPPPPPPAAAPARPAPPSRISVGGNVQSGLLLSQVTPAYPIVAKTARITGAVRLKALIGCDGKVKELSLISGHPLLIPAAEAAVWQWVYRPTLLNGTPVEVQTEVTVNFTLG